MDSICAVHLNSVWAAGGSMWGSVWQTRAWYSWLFGPSARCDSAVTHGRYAAHQAPLSVEFSGQDYWSGLPFLPPRDRPLPGIEPRSPSLVQCRRILYPWATSEACSWLYTGQKPSIGAWCLEWFLAVFSIFIAQFPIVSSTWKNT